MPSKPPLERMATTSPGASCGVMVGDDGISVGEKLGGRACVVEVADNLFRVQALGLRNALLLKNGGEHHSIGEARGSQ